MNEKEQKKKNTQKQCITSSTKALHSNVFLTFIGVDILRIFILFKVQEIIALSCNAAAERINGTRFSHNINCSKNIEQTFHVNLHNQS